MATVGDNVRRVRSERGWTQAQLARRIGTTASYLAQIERDTDTLTPKVILKLAKALKAEPAELLAGVFTEYDVMRGSVEPTPQQGLVQSDHDVRLLLQRWKRLDAAGRKLLLDLAERLEP